MIYSNFAFILYLLFFLDVDWMRSDVNLVTSENAERIRLINSILMSIGKLLYLSSTTAMLILVFSGRGNIYVRFYGNFALCFLGKLMYGAYLVGPIIAKCYIA